MYTLYKITNNINDKIYIGSTKNLKNRENRHRSDLSRNKHHSLYLQRFYNKYKDNLQLSFEIISSGHTKEEIKILEEECIEKYYENSFNMSKKSSGGDLISYHPNRDIIVNKMVKTIKEQRSLGLIKQPDTSGVNNPNYKDGSSIKVITICPSCGESWTTFKKYQNCLCRSCFASSRVGIKNSFYGKTHTEESKDKIVSGIQKSIEKKRKQGLPLAPNSLPVTIEGVTYTSSSEAGKALGISSSTILNRIRSNSFAFRFYNFKDQYKNFEDLHIERKDYFISIDHTIYENINSASEILKISSRKIYSRLESKNFPNYFRKCPTTIESIEEYISLKKQVE